MRVAILDGFSVTAQDLSWDSIVGLDEIKVYDMTSPEDTLQRCKGFDMILTNKVVIDSTIMSQLPELKYIGVLATGYNVVDIAYAREHGIVVTNIPAYSTDSVAQMVWSHILNIFNHVDHYARQNREGRWTRSPLFCYWDEPVHELAGKTIGIVGLGNIGMKVARIALAFGLKVMAVTSKRQAELENGIESVDLHTLLRNSDIVSLHCPLTAGNKGMINKESLRIMKQGSVLINTGRGGLVVESDLAEALDSGWIEAYGADVLNTEPPTAESPLLKAKNCYLTPHIAWASVESRKRLISICAENINAFICGSPINQVN
ncbi:MAG: D-2-hydroxyacid dehydrogenase [Bacteroidaceae bacterium]|nr:D-2-hydroxyacid dehydrogenase [Bacteroidaceae bacterium]